MQVFQPFSHSSTFTPHDVPPVIASLHRKKGLPSEINFPLTLAPMVGLTHCAFRQVLREYLPEGAKTIWPNEMLNSRRLPSENLSQVPESMMLGDESYWVPQILANEEDKIRLSLQKLYAHGAQGIDVNMGCPVKKALKHNYGVALMGDSEYAAEVVRSTVRYSQGPVSVKLRGTSLEKKGEWLIFCEKLEQAGASWLCLHPRTPEQKRRGQANWNFITELNQHLSLPLIGNGDIQVVEDVLAMLEQTQCAMVMAGRALTARPWLYWQLGQKLGFAPPPGKTHLTCPQTPEEEGAEYGRSLLRLWELMCQCFPESLAYRKFVFHLRTSAVWLEFGHNLQARVSGVKESGALIDVLHSFFSQPQRMSQRTDLRQ